MRQNSAREYADKYITKLIERGHYDTEGDVLKVAEDWKKLADAFEKIRD